MTIQWLAQASFVIKEQRENRSVSTLVLDPYGQAIGFSFPKLEAELVTVSHDHFDHNTREALSGKPFIINEPGEYEVAGFAIQAIPSFHDNASGAKRGANLIMRVDGAEFSFAHFGDFGQEAITPAQLEVLNEVDIALIPVGGFYTIDGGQAAKIIAQLEPKVVIPMHYQITGLAIKELSGPEIFFQAMGQKPTIIEGDWKVKMTDFPSEGTKIIQLTPQAKPLKK